MIDCCSLKPLDMDCLRALFERKAKIVTIEEGEMIGGFGSEIARVCVKENADAPVQIIGLENRFIAAAQTCSTRETLLDCVKTRRYTRARLSRLCAYALLNLTRDFAQTHRAPDYARVLGFRKSAAPLLKTIKQRSSIPLITKAANFDRSNPLFALDVLAQDLWSLGVSNPSLRASGRDFTTSPAILSR